MPFAQQTSRVYTKQNVEALHPDQFGVYGIFRQGCWIYVGKGDIRKRLLDHLNGDKPCILAAQPTHWVDEVCTDPIMSNREKQLILESQPLCNQKIG
jgi:hypothetical protein